MMGLGIWSMHFVGMLAFQMPMPTSYDLPLTGLSLVVPMIASAFALHVATAHAYSPMRLLVGGVLFGVAINGMHYTGMAAATFWHADLDPAIVSRGIIISERGAVAVAAATLLGLGLTLVGSLTDMERRKSERRLQILAATRSAASLEQREILETFCGLITPELADAVCILLREGDRGELRMARVSGSGARLGPVGGGSPRRQRGRGRAPDARDRAGRRRSRTDAGDGRDGRPRAGGVVGGGADPRARRVYRRAGGVEHLARQAIGHLGAGPLRGAGQEAGP